MVVGMTRGRCAKCSSPLPAGGTSSGLCTNCAVFEATLNFALAMRDSNREGVQRAIGALEARRPRSKRASAAAMLLRAQMAKDDGDVEEAIRCERAAMRSSGIEGRVSMGVDLAGLLVSTGREREAVELLWSLADTRTVQRARVIAGPLEVLTRIGQMDEASWTKWWSLWRDCARANKMPGEQIASVALRADARVAIDTLLAYSSVSRRRRRG